MTPTFGEAVRKLPRGLLGMLALVVACESFFGHNDAKFSRLEAHDWKTANRAARESDQFGGILCLGDSQVEFGILPLILEARSGQPAQCLAIQGGQAPSTYFLLRKALEAGAKPSALVVDWEPHLLRDGVDHNTRMWPELVDLRDAADLGLASRSPIAFGQAALGMLLPSYRERQEIRDNLMAAFRGETPKMGERIEMAWRNRMMNRGAFALAKDHVGHSTEVGPWGNPTETPWTPDPANDRFVKRTLQLAEAHGIPVYLMMMPIMPGLQEKYEKYGMDARYTAWVRRLQGKFPGLTVVDGRHSNYETKVFYNALHLDKEGSISASAALGDLIRRRNKGQGANERWVQFPPWKVDGTEVAVEDSTDTYQWLVKAGRVRQ